MIKELTEKEYQQLYSILQEKLSFLLNQKRNLFNFDVLDKIEGNITTMLKTSDSLIFKDYDNIYQVIDNFENNVEKYIEDELEKLGD